MQARPEISISPIPAFHDNYIWMIKNQQDKSAFVVDPGDASPVLKTLSKQGLSLAGILVTHHHHDHIGGISELLSTCSVPVYGPHNPSIKQIDHPLSEGDSITVFGLEFTIIEVPGHTLDHIAYFSRSQDNPVLFCGDTLFVSGCGRVFEGTYEQMYRSLEKLSKLPGATQVYCTHEYTLANLKFAKAVDGSNPDLKDFDAYCQRLRDKNIPTVPSSIKIEMKINPFLRCDRKKIKQAAEKHANSKLSRPEEIFKVIRCWKDGF